MNPAPKSTHLLAFILNTNENEKWLVTEVTPEYCESQTIYQNYEICLH